jgi:hypothetical protein
LNHPSLNNYHLIQHDKILHRESVAQNKSTSELLGRLTLTVHSPQPTQTTQPPPSALGATVRIGLVGDYWLREGLAKRIPPQRPEWDRRRSPLCRRGQPTRKNWQVLPGICDQTTPAQNTETSMSDEAPVAREDIEGEGVHEQHVRCFTL